MDRLIQWLDNLDDLTSLVIAAASPRHYLLALFILGAGSGIALLDIPPRLLAIVACVLLLPVVELGLCAVRMVGQRRARLAPATDP